MIAIIDTLKIIGTIVLVLIILYLLVRKEIDVVRHKDPAIKRWPEVFLYPSFWAINFHKIAHLLYKIKLFFCARLISQLSRFLTGIEIHPGAKIGKGVFIDHGMGVVIGETCIIGDNVLIYQGATLGGTGKETGKRHPTIMDNVMIGAGSKVLGPITVGKNSKIGAGSVVLFDIPENSTVVGIPGRINTKNCEQHPSDNLDVAKLPDPVSMEICALKHRLEILEKQNNNKEK